MHKGWREGNTTVLGHTLNDSILGTIDNNVHCTMCIHVVYTHYALRIISIQSTSAVTIHTQIMLPFGIFEFMQLPKLDVMVF